ncbi:MAG: HIT domain-containing protein [Chloroflexota bacterium]
MERIWAPWRIQYIEMKKPEGCILCDKPQEDNDVANYILYRGEKNYIMLNSYPYNPGHLLVSPYRHVASLEDMTDEERCEHYEMAGRAIKVLREVFQPAGCNMGANMGKVAGAGIDGHFHTHAVPRWQGDTNFMSVLADVRVLPQALADTYSRLKGKF